MDRFDPFFHDGYPFEQQPPMRQQGDRWPEIDGDLKPDTDADPAKPSDLDGN